MELRPYQRDCVEAVRAALIQHDSTLVEAATGVGKTVIFSHVAAEVAGRVVVVAHRDELIRQAADKLKAVTGESPGVEMGEERVNEQTLFRKPKVVVTSVQTMSRPARHAKFDPGEFDLVIIDEAH